MIHLGFAQGIISIEPCGALYWFLSSLQIPLTIFFTLWIYFSDSVQSTHTSHNQDPEKVQYITLAFYLSLKVNSLQFIYRRLEMAEDQTSWCSLQWLYWLVFWVAFLVLAVECSLVLFFFKSVLLPRYVLLTSVNQNFLTKTKPKFYLNKQ